MEMGKFVRVSASGEVIAEVKASYGVLKAKCSCCGEVRSSAIVAMPGEVFVCASCVLAEGEG